MTPESGTLPDPAGVRPRRLPNLAVRVALQVLAPAVILSGTPATWGTQRWWEALLHSSVPHSDSDGVGAAMLYVIAVGLAGVIWLVGWLLLRRPRAHLAVLATAVALGPALVTVDVITTALRYRA